MIKKILTIKIKKTCLQNNICQRVAPSNDLTINPPKLKKQAPRKTKKGPGIFCIKFMKFDLKYSVFQDYKIYIVFLHPTDLPL